MLKRFWRRNRRHLPIVVLLPLMAPVFMVLGASLIISFVVNSPFPVGSAPSGHWVSIFAQQNEAMPADDSLELLSKNQIQAHRESSQAPYIQAGHFNRQVTHESRVLDSRVAFVNPRFFARLGVNSSLQELTASQAIVHRDFATRHQLVESDVLVIGNMRFQIAGLLDDFAGVDRRTDIYFPMEHLDNAIYHQVPEHLREFITADLPLFFYAERADGNTPAQDTYEQYSLIYIDGIIYAPEEAASLDKLNQYILLAAVFLGVLFVLTDYALSIHWVQQRQGELALMATVGATNSTLMRWFLKKWLTARILMLSLICMLLPFIATYMLGLLGFSDIRISFTGFLKAVALLAALYAIALTLSARRLIRNLTELSASLRSIRASTRRALSSQLQWAGAALLLLIIVTTALFTSVLQFQRALAQPDHMNSEGLYAATFTLAHGYHVDSSTLQRRTQTVRTALQHFDNQQVAATATNAVPMQEPIYKVDVTSVGGRALRQPAPVAVANVGPSYQKLAQHTLKAGEWPRSNSEVAVNEALLRQFGLRPESLPELWFEESRYQVTAVVKDSFWLDPLSSPQPVIWRPTSLSSSNLLIHWSRSRSGLEQELSNLTSNLNNGIVVEDVQSIQALRQARMRLPYIMLNVLMVVAVTTMAIAIGCLWVAVNSWLATKKWALTVHLALGATTGHLRQQLLLQVIWPLLAFIPLSAAASLYIATIIDNDVEIIRALQITAVAIVTVITVVTAIVWKAYQRLLGLDAASLTKDVT